MLNSKRKINLETVYDEKKKNLVSMEYSVSKPMEQYLSEDTPLNPVDAYHQSTDYVETLVDSIIAEEFPRMKNNSLLRNLVLESLLENMGTVQSIKNVLLYTKENSVKSIDDVFFKDGDVHIRCSV